MEGPDGTQDAGQGYEAQSFQMEVWALKAKAREARPGPTEEALDAVEPVGKPTSVAVPIPVPTVQDVVCAYPWDCATAMRIVDCETGGTFNPRAVGDDHERGWFQIRFNHWGKPGCNPVHLFDPAYNTACAYSIWTEQGWRPWSCY